MTQKKMSLQEQLLKAGLASEAKARQINSGKQKEAKMQKHNKVSVADDVASQVQKAKNEQIAKDRELSAQKKQEAERKALAAQIRQLIELHSKDLDPDNGVAYHFIDNNKVKTLYVAEEIRGQLVKGSLGIVKFDKQYSLVPMDIAEKIRQRDEGCVLLLNDKEEKSSDDPYSAYQIPDDLVW